MRRRFSAILLCAVLAGCSHGSVRTSFPRSAGVPPGTTSINSSIDARISSGSTLGTLLAIGLLAAAWHESEMDRLGRPNGSSLTWVPPLDEARRVNEQSCTLPIEDSLANLRCR